MLKWIAGPLVGALIGYCTNYIAVKMLFRPRRAIYVFGHRLPLTPGAIPKGQPRLAKAVGEVVAGTLITGKDLENQLMNEDVENTIVGHVMSFLSLETPVALTHVTGDENALPGLQEKAANMVTNSVLLAAADVNMGELFATKGVDIIMEKLQGSIYAMFLNPGTLEPIARSLGENVQLAIADQGRSYLEPHVLEQLHTMDDMSILDLLDEANVDRCRVREALLSIYEDAVREGINKALPRLNLAGMIEDKINAMSMEELERLVLLVMKKELNAIVNLGALIGFILGLVMLVVK